MDKAVSIERRLQAMKQFHDAGVRTICFISPIFPGITDVPAIIRRVKDQCNFIWLENLNLRGSFRTTIMEYIQQKHPDLVPLYKKVYTGSNKEYWSDLDKQVKQFCAAEKLPYVVDDDSRMPAINDPPIVVNFFYHSEIKKSAKGRRK